MLRLFAPLAAPTALTATALFAPYASPAQAASGTEYADRVEAAVVKRTNEVREHRDRLPTRTNGCVDGVAEDWARHLRRTDTFEHNELGKILRRCDRSYASENLARVTANSQLRPRQVARTMVAAWMGSPDHRVNLLAKRAKVTAVGVRKSADGQYWIAVQNFADRN